MNDKSAMLMALLLLMGMISVWYWLRLRGVEKEKEKRRIPRHWPLHSRPLVNSEELRLWRWLMETFDDHHVMIKVPVTRFTRPNPSENGLYWYGLLKNTTCTFTVISADGNVIGCVDVPKPTGLSLKSRNLKHNLLAQCGITYMVVNPSRLPDPAEIRNEFLGEAAAKSRDVKREEAAVARNLRKTLGQQREMRPRKDSPEYKDSTMSGMPTGWGDSYLIQANSRPAVLRHADGRLVV